MFTLVLQGITFGFAAGVQPGPFQSYLISQTLTAGWRRAIPVAFAPLISDGPIIILALFALNHVPPWWQRFFYLAGGLFILYLAIGAIRAWREYDSTHLDKALSKRQTIFQAVTINFLNPGPYLFWGLVTGPILLAAWHTSPAYGIGFVTAFYVTLVTVTSGLVLLFGVTRHAGPKINRSLLGLSAIALICLGGYQLWLGLFR